MCTLHEGSALLGVSVSTIRRLVEDGTLPVIRLRRRVLIDPTDIEELIARAKQSMSA